MTIRLPAIRPLLSILACLLASGLLLYWLWYGRGHVVAAFGFVSGQVAQVGSPLDGQVDIVEVRPGARVREGQVLMQLRQVRQRAALDQAYAKLGETEARLEVERARLSAQRLEAQARHSEAEAELSMAEAELGRTQARLRYSAQLAQRFQELRAKGVATGASAESTSSKEAEAEQRVAQAEGRVARAQARLQRAGARRESVRAQQAKVRLLEAGVQSARSGVHQAEAELELTVVRAPRAGILTRSLVSEGTAVRVGSPLVELWYEGELGIEAWLEESSYGDLEIGAPAEMHVVGLTDAALSGRVAALGVVSQGELRQAAFSLPLARALGKSRWVRARIELDRNDVRLLPGLTAEVSITRGRRGLALPPRPTPQRPVNLEVSYEGGEKRPSAAEGLEP